MVNPINDDGKCFQYAATVVKKKTSSKNSIKINTLMIKHFAQLEIIVIILVTVEVLHITCVI